MVVIPAQSDPSELLQLVALRVPLHHMSCLSPCSFRLSPGDGDTVVAFSYCHNLKGLCWKRRCTYKYSELLHNHMDTNFSLDSVLLMHLQTQWNKHTKFAFLTFCVMGCNPGGRGQPFGVARPHCHFTVGAERDWIIPGIGTNVGAEDQDRVWAVNSNFVPCDFPSGDGNVCLLQSEKCLKVNHILWHRVFAFIEGK